MRFTVVCARLSVSVDERKKGNEKRKKHESSENVSERKTAGREKGSACKHLLKYLNPPTTPPTSRKHVKMSKFAGADSREFAD